MYTAVEKEKPITSQWLGRHILAEFWGCDSNVLNNVSMIEKMMKDAAVKCGATVVDTKFHMFNPYGVSGVVIIAESHLAIHTWPEFGYAAADFFTCGTSCDPEVAYEHLKSELNSSSASYTELKRGTIDETRAKLIEAPFEIHCQK